MDNLETKVAQPTQDYNDVLSTFEAFKHARTDSTRHIGQRYCGK